MARGRLRTAGLLACVCTAQSSSIQVRSVTMHSSDGPSVDEAAAAAAVLQEDGVVVLLCEALEALAPPCDNALQILAGQVSRVQAAGLNIDQPFSFAEICHRSPRRYDVHLGSGLSESAFSTLVNALVRPVIAQCEGDSVRIIRDGLVTSLPGASPQPFHADGRGVGLYNAFLPLVPVASAGAGTEFWIGSHLDERSAARLQHEGKYVGDAIIDDPEVLPNICAPTLRRAEGIVLFDYRLIHRGRGHGANEKQRPVFYRVYARNGAAEDTHNWPDRRVPPPVAV